MEEFAIYRLVSGGLITNYFCTSKCGHCLYNCSPHRKKRYMDPTTAEELMRAVRSLGCRSVHVGGGEPLLDPQKLSGVLEAARRARVSVDYVETNSSWFKDPASAQEMLRELRRRGLSTLLISISPFHNEYIPFSRVRGAIAACRNAGMNIFPWINDFVGDLTAFDETRTHPLHVLAEKFGEDYLSRVLDRYWVHMGGRALKTFRPVLKLMSFEEIVARNPGGCRRELSDATHFHVDLFGNYIPGLCSGLSIAVADLGRPLTSERYPIVSTLVRSGIRGLAELARNVFDYTPGRSGYINKCDVCTEIRAVFSDRGFGGPVELNPKGFYEEIGETVEN